MSPNGLISETRGQGYKALAVCFLFGRRMTSKAASYQAELQGILLAGKRLEQGEGMLSRLLVMIGEKADHIQKLSKYRRDLCALCDFSQAQRIRRLLTVRAYAWRELEERWAKGALAEIERLRGQEGYPAALALACFGVWRPDLGDAIQELELAKGRAAVSVETAVQQQTAAREPEPEKPVAREKPKITKTAKPVKPLESLDDLDEDELDPQTLAELEALKAEVDAMTKKMTS